MRPGERFQTGRAQIVPAAPGALRRLFATHGSGQADEESRPMYEIGFTYAEELAPPEHRNAYEGCLRAMLLRAD